MVTEIISCNAFFECRPSWERVELVPDQSSREIGTWVSIQFLLNFPEYKWQVLAVG